MVSGGVPRWHVPWNDPSVLMRLLKQPFPASCPAELPGLGGAVAGAVGIICPMINTREEAEFPVSCMRYPPHGQRSMGPTRAVFAHGSDYADLTLGLIGREYPTGFDREEPEMIEAIKEICARAHEAGICIHESRREDQTLRAVMSFVADKIARLSHLLEGKSGDST
jgi:4-hydroxy-2-oxoheptanedioate aldolase